MYGDEIKNLWYEYFTCEVIKVNREIPQYHLPPYKIYLIDDVNKKKYLEVFELRCTGLWMSMR